MHDDDHWTQQAAMNVTQMPLRAQLMADFQEHRQEREIQLNANEQIVQCQAELINMMSQAYDSLERVNRKKDELLMLYRGITRRRSR